MLRRQLKDYLKAMSARDVEGLQAVLDKHFVGVEAADNNAKVHFVHTDNSRELLPPEGNHDWDKIKPRLSSFKAEVSTPHPSVAMASFTMTYSLPNETLGHLEAALKQMPAEADESKRKEAAKIIADRAIHNSMFAMLARQDGKWKIVCMSFPK